MQPGKYGSYLTIAAMLIVLTGLNGFAATAHPDGCLGRAGGWFSAGYASVYVERGIPGFDRTNFAAGLIWPAIASLTFESSYALEYQDTLFHKYSVGFRARLGDPLKTGRSVNTDGRVGVPFINIAYTGKLPDVETENHSYHIDYAVMLPISTGFTIGGGGRYYEVDGPRQVDKFHGRLNYFPQKYPSGAEYENPDGIEGSPSFSLIGGGSELGFFGQLNIAVPIESDLTLTLTIRGERIPSPYVRTAFLGGRISYYSGN